MLKQRVVTALILVGALVACLYYLNVAGLALVFGLVVAAGSWEWSRLAGLESVFSRSAYVLLAAMCMTALFYYCSLAASPLRETVQPFLGLACLWWSIALLWIKGYPGSAVLWGSRPMRALMGLLALIPAWLAAVYLLTYPMGALLLVALVANVAAADIGAYFTGRSFGRHKLALEVSPGKTWEGFWGGMVSVMLLAVVVFYTAPAVQFDRVGLGGVLSVALITALASVVGDLLESMVKRQSGMKDSGSLLPGHGGFLDRLDSLCAAAPVFALGLILADW